LQGQDRLPTRFIIQDVLKRCEQRQNGLERAGWRLGERAKHKPKPRLGSPSGVRDQSLIMVKPGAFDFARPSGKNRPCAASGIQNPRWFTQTLIQVLGDGARAPAFGQIQPIGQLSPCGVRRQLVAHGSIVAGHDPSCGCCDFFSGGLEPSASPSCRVS
jgi:hypothetical protein